MDIFDPCTICNERLLEEIDQIDSIKVKGLQTLITKSKEKGDGKWKDWIDKSLIKVHRNCRTSYLINMKVPRKRKLNSPEVVEEESTSYGGEAGHIFGSPPSQPQAFHSQKETIRPDPEAASHNTIHNENNFDYSTLCVFCSKILDRYRKQISTFSKKNNIIVLQDMIKANSSKDSEELLERIGKAPFSIFSYHRNCYKMLKVSIILFHLFYFS